MSSFFYSFFYMILLCLISLGLVILGRLTAYSHLAVMQTKSLNKPFIIHALVSGLYVLKFKFLDDNLAHWINIIFQTGCTLTLLIAHVYLINPFFPLFSHQSVPRLGDTPTSAFSAWVTLAFGVATPAVINKGKYSWADLAILWIMFLYFEILSLAISIQEEHERKLFSANSQSSPTSTPATTELDLGKKTAA